MFLGQKDPDHNPPGKALIMKLRSVAFWILFVAVFVDSQRALIVALIIACVLTSYYLYLLITKQTYWHYLQKARAKNEAKVKKYKK